MRDGTIFEEREKTLLKRCFETTEPLPRLGFGAHKEGTEGLVSFLFFPFHIESGLSVESPDAQADGEEEEAEHEAGFGIEGDIDPTADIEEEERGGDDNEPPYADLQDLGKIRPQVYRAVVMMCGDH